MQPSEEQAFARAVNDLLPEHAQSTLVEGVGDVLTGLIYETQQGHSIEFALTDDISDDLAEAVVDLVSSFCEDCTVEVSGDS